jgi:hypothetical protein
MNTFNQGGPENLKNPSRRGFLGDVGKILAGVVAVTAAATVVVKANKYMDAEKNSLLESLKGQEENPKKAYEVIGLLLDEMNSANPPLQKIRLSSEDGPTNTIEILRDFLTFHLNSHIGHKYSIKKEVFESGYYTKENLSLLRLTADRLIKEEEEERKRKNRIS